MKKRFLTVYAVLDDITQNNLKELQRVLIDYNLLGTQIKEIPYHISLGSFPLDKKTELESLIQNKCMATSTFNINLLKINHFKNKVLYIEPEINDNLINLQRTFDGNYADNYDWTPHVTLFCGNWLQVIKAKKYIKSQFVPFTATITSIQMSEFFTTNIIIDQPLQTNINLAMDFQ